ncbi:MAG: serine hydrolase [Candidatus Saccharimonadales bacterium]
MVVVILGKFISNQRLLIILFIVIVMPTMAIMLFASTITIAESHLVSVDRIKPKLSTVKLIVPKKLGQDKIKPSSATQPTAPPPLTGLAKAESSQLQSIVDNFANSQKIPFGIYIKDLKNNAIAIHNQATVFPSASLYKLYVADLIFHQIDINNIVPSAHAGNSSYSIRDCLDRMITVSDNDCGIELGNIVQWNLANPTIIARGYTNTNLNDPPQTTAGDTGKLLEHLYQQLGETSNNDQLIFLELLKQQQLNRNLPAGLPAGTVIAHKTGDFEGYIHDVGIVYGAKTNYVISVLSGPWPDADAAAEAFANLSQQIYQVAER